MTLNVVYVFLIVIYLSYNVYTAEKWRDPHEMRIDKPNHDTAEPSCEKQGEQNAAVLMYYKRSLGLLTAHLAHDRKDPYTHNFNLHIHTKHYSELIRAIEDVDYDLKSLRQLDAVLSRVYGKEITDNFTDAILSLTEYIQMNFFTKECAVLLFTLMLPLIIYCYQTSSRQTIVIILLFFIWAADFTVTWYNKYEDLEVENMVDMSRYVSSEPTCDLSKMWFYEKWFSSLSPTEECKRYYTAKYKNKSYQIGPYDIVIEQVGKLMKIFRFIAIESSKFLSLLTSEIPWPLNWIVIILVVIMGFYTTQLCLFLLFGYSFKLNLAHLFQFEIRNEQQPRQNREFREMIQEVRQLPNRITDAVRTRDRNEIKQEQTENQSRIIDNIPVNIGDNSQTNTNLNKPEIATSNKPVSTSSQTATSSATKTTKHSEVRAEANATEPDRGDKPIDGAINDNDTEDSSSSESIEVCEELIKNIESDTDFEFISYTKDGAIVLKDID